MATRPAPRKRRGSARLIDFARTAELIGATSKRLERAARPGRFLTLLGDDDLAVAARMRHDNLRGEIDRLETVRRLVE